MNATHATTTKIDLITQAAVDTAVGSLGLTAKTLHDGSPNPFYAKRLAEIEYLKAHRAAREQVERLAANAGYRLNSYVGVCCETGVEVKPYCGFVRKNAAGKWQTYAFAVIQKLVGVEVELPVEPE